ncbi:aldehyde dehydrogenase family protein [Sphingomonas profundi]|uniref:aldehyde dehydrogenase family protein n=1 Tax=Alterirhizorhabdus profundi TaxID=2681549 RepID=UPI0012E7DA4F|nr:aldehyde dehydrogenase family protein [Sphingomonas profundi]
METTTNAEPIDRRPPALALIIDGEAVTRTSGGHHAHISPMTGEAQAEIPLAGVAEIDAAVDAAHRAFAGWRATPGAERRRCLLKLADLIEQHAAEFGRLAAIECGIPVAVGEGYAPGACADWIRYYAGWADKLEGQLLSTFPAEDFAYVAPEPYGVIGLIITWNGPLVSLGMKVPAALAAGNSVVIKPSEMAPFVPALFGRLAKLAGFPDGVVNVVPGGPEAGARLIEHPLVEKISFTGGPATARRILHACADLLKPTVMELGGKAANIIFDDVDPDAAAAQAVYHSLGVLSGQGCAIPTRVVVQNGIYDALIERMVALAEAMKVGDPFERDTAIGPLINEAAAVRVTGLIETAKAGGAMRLLTGGGRVGGVLAGGAYVAPTLFADVDPADPLAQNEIFGPVLTIHRFRDEAEAIAIANATRYGLGGYLHTNDLRRAHQVAAAMRTGNVFVNTAKTLDPAMPFGGTGISGFGREGGKAGIEEFVRHKAVGIARG